MTFAGFPSSGRATAIPSVFFSDVLPQLADDPAVVGVALYAFNALMAKRGFPRELTVEELLADAGLAAYLKRSGCVSGEDAAETSRVVAGGLGRCVDAGVLLALIEESGDGEREVYFLNTPSDRRAMETVQAEGMASGRIVPFRPALEKKKGVFALYEQEIGTLTPQIVEQLTEAEQLYPGEWIERAFREAAAQNARSWRYVQRILERWAIEGIDDAGSERDAAGGERYYRGKYGRILQERDRT